MRRDDTAKESPVFELVLNWWQTNVCYTGQVLIISQIANMVVFCAIRFLRRQGKKFRAGRVSQAAHTAKKKLTLESVE